MFDAKRNGRLTTTITAATADAVDVKKNSLCDYFVVVLFHACNK